MLWTAMERTRLRELRPHHDLRYIAAELGRPYSAVAHEASRMKLGRPTGRVWSEQESAEIASLWPYCSAGVIAKRLKRSRNAVIGKVYRLRDEKKLQHRASPKPLLNNRQLPKPTSAPAPRVRDCDTRVRDCDTRVRDTRMPMQCPCQLIELDAINCHWPYGDPRQQGFHFCGALAVAGRPYCATHLRLAHHPEPSSRSIRHQIEPA